VRAQDLRVRLLPWGSIGDNVDCWLLVSLGNFPTFRSAIVGASSHGFWASLEKQVVLDLYSLIIPGAPLVVKSVGIGILYFLTLHFLPGPDNYQKLRLPEIAPYLNFYNLMAYDYSGKWSTVADHQANLNHSNSNAQSTPFSTVEAITSTKEESPPQRCTLECRSTATHLPTQMGRELLSKARATETIWKVESWLTKPSLRLAGRNL